MERAVRQIRGVYDAHVVLGPTESIDEIHVIASPLRKPKQVVRDIESMLLVSFGIRVDYRRISLVQMDEERTAHGEGRARLVAVRALGGTQGRAEVDLEKDGQMYTAVAQGPATGLDLQRLVCTATMRAVEQTRGEPVDFTVQDVRSVSAGNQEAIVVVVTIAQPTGPETLLGVSQVRDDPAAATARATLSAVNRRLLMPKSEVAQSGV